MDKIDTAALKRKKMTETGVLKILSAVLRMDAETFCDRWFGLDQLEPEEREQVKQERGYRARCVRILSAVLRKPEKTISNWGSRFEAMPEDYEVTLTYADALRVQLQASPDRLLSLFLERRSREEN
jgi:hypothetical protein